MQHQEKGCPMFRVLCETWEPRSHPSKDFRNVVAVDHVETATLGDPRSEAPLFCSSSTIASSRRPTLQFPHRALGRKDKHEKTNRTANTMFPVFHCSLCPTSRCRRRRRQEHPRSRSRSGASCASGPGNSALQRQSWTSRRSSRSFERQMDRPRHRP